MNAALSSVRSRALEAVSQFSSASSSSHTSLPTTSAWRSSERTKSKRSFDRPRLFARPLADKQADEWQSNATATTMTTSALTNPSRSTVLFILGCLAWYTSSSLSSNTSKALLSKPKPKPMSHTNPASPPAPAVFPYPVTLTLIHFGFVNVCCFLCSSSSRILGRHSLTRLVRPSFQRVREVGQLAFFNVLGQALSSLAISRVPVATVHTIKALSPLFTVLSYTYFFKVRYSSQTYLSLIPLTLGVMMACTGFAFNADDIVGFGAALTSTFVFVAQNIYSKKLLRNNQNPNNKDMAGAKIAGDEASAGAEKMDKLNILFYSSGCSFILMIPMAMFYDGYDLVFNPSWKLHQQQTAGGGGGGGTVLWLLLCNGLVHFAQNILAFNVLAMVSPVTYSIASLLKRVFVIVLAILWFHQSVSLLQWLGIAMTFYGLWMYNDSKTKQDVLKGEKKVARKQQQQQQQQEGNARGLEGILPLTSSPSSSTTTSSLIGNGGLYNRPHPSSSTSSAAFNHYQTQNHPPPPPPAPHYRQGHQGGHHPAVANRIPHATTGSQVHNNAGGGGGWNDVPESMFPNRNPPTTTSSTTTAPFGSANGNGTGGSVVGGGSKSYIQDPTKSLPSPPDSDKET